MGKNDSVIIWDGNDDVGFIQLSEKRKSLYAKFFQVSNKDGKVLHRDGKKGGP